MIFCTSSAEVGNDNMKSGNFESICWLYTPSLYFKKSCETPTCCLLSVEALLFVLCTELLVEPFSFCFCRPTFCSLASSVRFVSYYAQLPPFCVLLFLPAPFSPQQLSKDTKPWVLLATSVSRRFEFLRHLFHLCQLQLMISISNTGGNDLFASLSL